MAGMKGLTLGIALGLTSLGSMAQENYKPKYNTLAHKMLEASGQKYITPKTLDEIIDSSKKLIETVADEIAQQILLVIVVDSVQVTITKPSAEINQNVTGNVSVTIVRNTGN